MALHHRTFTVRGRGEFPLDMLRYDCCWPRRSEDVMKIQPGYHDATADSRNELGVRDVDLAMYTPIKRGSFTEVGRWRSFGWEVVGED